ncbi:SsrA-binding protein [Candidatus Tremblaya princeps]|uniref:SsrA-binding protein n=1 Tax=Tremblaya princeps TaxID=189385 RepID=A0A143WRN4_TREPR|nr:SsrA-binding protein [Candidatus Tremblaya princeps]
MSRGVFCENKKCSSRIAVVCKYEAGMALRGWEVSSIRASSASLLCATLRFASGRPVLVGVSIPPRPTCALCPRSARPIPLLLHRAEAIRMEVCLRRKGYVAMPAALYDKGGYIKCLILVGRRIGVRNTATPAQRAERCAGQVSD